MKGTVKWFNDDKGYGFITPEDGGKDLFVHFADIEMTGRKTLKDGQLVIYAEAVQNGAKGMKAIGVMPD